MFARTPRRLIPVLVFMLMLVSGGTAQAQKMRVAYWTSGVSLGFGSVLESGKFLEKEGLDVEYIKFSDVNAPTKAIAAGSGTCVNAKRRALLMA